MQLTATDLTRLSLREDGSSVEIPPDPGPLACQLADLYNETDVIAIDWRDQSICIRDSGTPANDLSERVDDGVFADNTTGIAYGAHQLMNFSPGVTPYVLSYDGKFRPMPHNHLDYSENFDLSPWALLSCSSISQTGGSTTPSGGTSYILTCSLAASQHYLGFANNTSTCALGQNNVLRFTLWCKKTNWDYIQLAANSTDAGTQSYANFDIGASPSVGTYGTNVSSATITTEDGWIRCDMVFKMTSTVSSTGCGIQIHFVNSASATRAVSFNPSPTTPTLELWKAQVRKNDAPNIYVKSYRGSYEQGDYFRNLVPVEYNTSGTPIGLKAHCESFSTSEQSENSMDFTQSNWVLTNMATPSQDVTPGMIGDRNAWTLADSNGGGSGVCAIHDVATNNPTTNLPVQLHAIVKAGNSNWCYLEQDQATSSPVRTYFNLSTGSLGTQTSDSAKIVSLGNGWYHILTKHAITGTVTNHRAMLGICDADNSTSCSLNGGSSIKCAYFLCEAYLTSTGGSNFISVPWVLEVGTNPSEKPANPYSILNLDPINIGTPLDDAAGSWYCYWLDNSPATVGVGPWKHMGAAGITSNYFHDMTQDSSGNMKYEVGNAGTTNGCLITCGTATPEVACKMASRYGTDDFAASFNGATTVTDTSGTPPAEVDMSEKIIMGCGYDLQWDFLHGYVYQWMWVGRKYSDGELEDISTL